MEGRPTPPTFLVFSLALLSLGAAAALPGTKLIPISRAKLCVTEGAIEELPGNRLAVNVSKMRA